MNTTTIIEHAVKIILDARDIQIPDSRDDRYFLGDTILRISEVLSRDGAPTIEMRNMSIEIGELTPADCQAGHITLRSHDQMGRRDADSLSSFAYYLQNADPSKLVEFGQTFAFDVCQACPAFVAAVHEVHSAGFTADAVHERAKAYWIAAYGFWA